MEENIIISIQSIYSDILVFMTTFFSYIASWIGFALVLIIFLLFTRLRFGLTYLITSGVVSGIVNLIKIIVKKERPFMINPEILNLFEASGYSMPSGHTANAVVIALFCSYLVYKSNIKKAYKVLIYVACGIFIFFVMFSRMFLGQHFLSDTLVSLLIGGAISVLSLWMYEKYISKMNFQKKK